MTRTKTVEYPDDDRSDSTTIYAEHPAPTPKLLERCGDHGERLTEISVDERNELTIERGGMTYHLADPAGTAVAYCEECFAESRNRSHEMREMSDIEILKRRLKSEFRPHYGDGFADLFASVAETAGDGLKCCPFCGEEFGTVNQKDGRGICPDHGDMTIDIRQHDA